MLKKREEEYIKSNWEKYFDYPPFNFCDRLCDECRFTHCCSLYFDEKKWRLGVLRQGKDPNDPVISMKEVRKNISQTFKLLQKMAKKDGVDLEELEKDFPEEYKKYTPKKFSVCSDAKKWLDMNLKILEDFHKKVRDDFRLIHLYPKLDRFEHYIFMTPSKLYRAMSQLSNSSSKKKYIGDGMYEDAARSACLVLRIIRYCSKILCSMAELEMNNLGCRCAEAIILGNKIEEKIRKKFPDIDRYNEKIIFNSL